MIAPAHTGTVRGALARAARLLENDPARAAKQAENVLAAQPASDEARYLLGAARRRCGDPNGAIKALDALAKHHSLAALELGRALAAIGDHARAMAAWRHAVSLQPTLAAAWRAQGDLLTIAADPDGADAAYARAGLADATGAQAGLPLVQAAKALCRGEPEAAELLLAAAVRQPRPTATAHCLLALAKARLGDTEAARQGCANAAALAPRDTAPRHFLAILLLRLRRQAEAAPHIAFLLRADPQDACLRHMMALCLIDTGDWAPTIAIYDGFLRDNPGQPRVHMLRGHALSAIGRTAEAIAAYRASMALAPGLAAAFWSLANLKTAQLSDAELGHMRTELARPTLRTEDRAQFHYAIGSALEQRRDYADSFTHYAEGARLRRTQIDYDADAGSAQTAREIATFTPAFFAARQGGCSSAAPIFIVGMPRAGSTLIEQILASHPRVEGTMELRELGAIAAELPQAGPYPACLETLDAARRQALGELYIERTRIYRKTGRPLFIDKNPANFAHIGLIQLILPQAKIIDARRAPMAAGFAVFKQFFASGHEYSYDLAEIARYYRDYTALLSHFDAVLPGRVHRVQYEDMVENTEAEIRRLLAYCGLDFAPSCLRFYENTRAVRTPSSEQVRQPIFRSGLEQWRHYDEWLGALRQSRQAK